MEYYDVPFDVDGDSGFGDQVLPPFHPPGGGGFSSDPESWRAYEDYKAKYDRDYNIAYYNQKLAVLKDRKWFTLYTAWNNTDNSYI